MNFTEIRQTMTDDACEVVSALRQASGLTLHAIIFITRGGEHTTRFILEQMAALGVATQRYGLWQLTSEYQATAR
ncbi:hypothetical protein [Serratia bockelmannii]|uniref:hypothetical protein n=1 Tax=Serratia bockelmannii TaxID=2703793 RepID=UPI003FA6C59B